MLKGIHHTGLTVPNLNDAIAFYCGAGDFKLVHEFTLSNSAIHRKAMGVDNASARVAWLRGTLGFLELFEFESPSSPKQNPTQVNDTGIRHICLQAKDGDNLFDKACDLGARSHARPCGLGTGNIYAYVRDPFDNVIELEGIPYAPGENLPTWYAHTAYVVREISNMVAFYEVLTGHKRSREGTFGPSESFDTVSGLKGTHIKGAWIHFGNGNLEFWQYLTPVSATKPANGASDFGYSHVCFEVEDMHQCIQKLQAIGTRFLSEPIESQNTTLVYGLDPEDNLFELIAFKKDAQIFSLDNLSGWDFFSDLSVATTEHYKLK